MTIVTTEAGALQARLDDYWSGRAEAYHSRQVDGERAAVARSAWLRIWADALGAAQSARVVDVGTGTGYVAHVIAELGHDVIGVDSSPGMLSEARADAERRRAAGLPHARFHTGDAVALQVPDLVVPADAVVSRYVLWTLREPVAALRSWVDLLAPGGLVACVDANWYPNGIDRTVQVESTAGPDAFVETYDADVEAGLPLATVAGHEAYVETFAAAGLVDVRVRSLEEIAEIDRRFGVSPGHEPRPQFLVTGRVATSRR